MRWQRKHDDVHEIETTLRRQRPQPAQEFVDALARQIRAERLAKRPRVVRSSFAAAVLVVALVALAGFGGLGRAASAVSNSASAAADTVKSAVSPNKETSAQQSANSEYSSKTKAAQTEYHGKQAVCHKGKKTLYLPPSAVPAHLNHGDTLGPCPGD